MICITSIVKSGSMWLGRGGNNFRKSMLFFIRISGTNYYANSLHKFDFMRIYGPPVNFSLFITALITAEGMLCMLCKTSVRAYIIFYIRHEWNAKSVFAVLEPKISKYNLGHWLRKIKYVIGISMWSMFTTSPFLKNVSSLQCISEKEWFPVKFMFLLRQF